MAGVTLLINRGGIWREWGREQKLEIKWKKGKARSCQGNYQRGGGKEKNLGWGGRGGEGTLGPFGGILCTRARGAGVDEERGKGRRTPIKYIDFRTGGRGKGFETEL